MKEFLKGQICFGKGFDTDEKQKAFLDKHKDKMQEICDWCDEPGIAIQFGFTEDGEAVCTYDISGRTCKFCKTMQKELFSQIRQGIGRYKKIAEISGTRLW